MQEKAFEYAFGINPSNVYGALIVILGVVIYFLYKEKRDVIRKYEAKIETLTADLKSLVERVENKELADMKKEILAELKSIKDALPVVK